MARSGAGGILTHRCPACKGEVGNGGGTCQYCGGDLMVSRRTAKVIKRIMAIKSASGRIYPLQVVTGMRRLDAERVRLAELPVPASFTGHIPDTAEAEAARRQIATTKGKDLGWHSTAPGRSGGESNSNPDPA